MTARTATVRLYVTVVSLVTAVLALVVTLLKLVTAAVAWAAARVEARVVGGSRPVAAAPIATAPTELAPRAHLKIVPRPAAAGPSQADKLTTALVGLGFRAPDVRRFVGGLGGRVETAPLEALIKDGLRFLSPAVAS